MSSMSVEFRGERVDIEFKDHGYEPDTNAHDVDWHFVDPALQSLDLTQDEEDSIYIAITTRKEYD